MLGKACGDSCSTRHVLTHVPMPHVPITHVPVPIDLEVASLDYCHVVTIVARCAGLGRNMAAMAARGLILMAVADDFHPPPRFFGEPLHCFTCRVPRACACFARTGCHCAVGGVAQSS